MYDWANSAYSTLSITILFAYLKLQVFPKETWNNVGGVVWAWGIGLSMLVAAVLSPILGALADAHSTKAAWLRLTAISGASAAVGLALVPTGYPWTIACVFVLTSFFFELSLGFYNSFLPEICDEDSMDRVSAWGFAMGYIGGAMALIVAAALLLYGPKLGLTTAAASLRAGLLVMGLWWGLFSLPALIVLRDRKPARRASTGLRDSARQAVSEVRHTLGHLRSYRTLAWFLIGFLFYNDGVQTVISQASQFAVDDLKFNQNELIGVILMIQFLAFPGALLCGYLSSIVGQKPTLIGCLLVWLGLLVAAYFVQSKLHFWALGAAVALVMGGTQSVSRAVVGMMTPPDRSAEFFGFFNLSGKATSFMGTFLFGTIFGLTGSARLAILSLLVQFVIGLAIVAPLRFSQGRRDARPLGEV